MRAKWSTHVQLHFNFYHSLLEVEKRMRKGDNYQRLPHLQRTISQAVTGEVRNKNFN